MKNDTDRDANDTNLRETDRVSRARTKREEMEAYTIHIPPSLPVSV